jgi:predicted O-linked N-acetylglucosamine transferase (SPINDLY family)
MQSETPPKSALAALHDACTEAMNHQIAGRLESAEKLYRELLHAEPRHAAANHCIGMLYVQLRRPEAALPHLLASLEEDPKSPNYWLGYLEALLSGGQTDAASSTLKLARQHGLEGHAVEEFARRLEAKLLASAAEKSPGAQVSHGKQARSDQRRQLRLALKREAQLFALVKQRRFAEAIELGRTLTELHPERGQGWKILGALLWANGSKEAALGAMQIAAALLPRDAETHANLGTTLNELEQLDAAEFSLRRALELDPNLAAAHVQLGNTYQLKGQYLDAERSIRSAISLQPEDVKIGDKFIYSTLLFILSHKPSVDADSLFAEHCRVGAIIEARTRASWPRHANDRDPDRRLQVGFVSGDLCNHVVAHFIEPVLAQLERCQGLELHAYYNNPAENAVSRRMREYFAHWTPVSTLEDTQLAKTIMGDRIDILIDLSGHTSLNRLRTFARKPAPIQASWVGYPGTTGLTAMDYYLADKYWLPPGQFETQFTEKLVYLPANVPFQPHASAPAVNPLPALAAGAVTFGSFNRLGKINAATIRSWSELMRAVPASTLLVGGLPVEGPCGLLEQFASHGIAPERLKLHPRGNMDSYLALHHQVDICLDTFPYTGGTTTNHALWMGVPTLTIAGQTPAARQGAGILGHMRLDGFIAANEVDFVVKGMHWASHLPVLAEVRAGLRDRCRQSPVLQPVVIVDAFERALRRMWKRWCAGLSPDSFETVTPSFSELGRDAISASGKQQ